MPDHGNRMFLFKNSTQKYGITIQRSYVLNSEYNDRSNLIEQIFVWISLYERLIYATQVIKIKSSFIVLQTHIDLYLCILFIYLPIITKKMN